MPAEPIVGVRQQLDRLSVFVSDDGSVTDVNVGCFASVWWSCLQHPFPARLSGLSLQSFPSAFYFVPFSRLSELLVVQEDGAVERSPKGRLLNKRGLILNNVVPTVIVQKVF